MPETSSKKAAATVATGDDKSVSTFMKPATILFGLVFLAIGGCVLLYIKFRSMDKQIRLLTKQVAQVPSEDDFRMAQESWAHQFHQKQTEQTAMVMERLEGLTRMAEATRAHLHQIETRGESQSLADDTSVDSDPGPTSRVDTSAQFNIDEDSIQLADPPAGQVEDVEEVDEDVDEDVEEVDEDVEEVDEDVEEVDEDVEEVDEDVEEAEGDVDEVVEAASEDDDDMPTIAAKDTSSSSSSSSSTTTSEEPMPEPRLPNLFTQPLESPPVQSDADVSEEAPKEDVLESSLDLDADESEIESEASN